MNVKSDNTVSEKWNGAKQCKSNVNIEEIAKTDDKPNFCDCHPLSAKLFTFSLRQSSAIKIPL